MKLAILGTRGIPASYGGFETLAEELGSRLAARGHDVTVYCRAHHVDPRLHGTSYRGVRLRVLRTIRSKYLDTVMHSALSAIDCLWRRYDAVLICNAANSMFALLPRLAGARVVINVDGIERRRKKWSAAGRAYYRAGEWLATKLADVVIADAEVIRTYYRDIYGVDSVMIAYGARTESCATRDAVDRFGLEPGRYVLYVSRLEPENNAEVVIRAFRNVETSFKLVIVGDAPYADQYKRELLEAAGGDPRILFAGFVFGEGYRELQRHAACYVQATEVGGTHPALVEAMGAGLVVIANDTPEHREVGGDAVLYYAFNDPRSLSQQLEAVLNGFHAELGAAARCRTQALYSWRQVTLAYEQVLTPPTAH